MAFGTPTAYYTNSGAIGTVWSSADGTLSVTASAGDFVVVIANNYNTVRTFEGITDSTAGSNTWRTDVEYETGGEAHHLAIYSSKLAADITSVTVSLNLASTDSYSGITALVWTEEAATSWYDTATATRYSSNTTSMSTGTTGTTSQADGLAVAACFCGASTNIQTNTSGYTNLNPFGNTQYLEIAYKITTSIGTESCTFTLDTTRTGTAGIAVYNASSVGLSVSAYEPSVTVTF